MTEYQPRRFGPVPSNQVWIWPATRSAQSGPVRIGDAERDKAVSALGDHFAAGRLSQEEFDERVEAAISAKFDRDLEPLFTDLPRAPEPTRAPTQGWPGPRAVLPALLMSLGPFLLVAAVIGAIAFHLPVLIWGFIWVFMFTGVWGRRRYQHHGPYRR
jgi:hypothetical protein